MVAQYARQVNYLECKVTNSFKNPQGRCDCEKIFPLKKNATDQSPVPVRHNHLHVDDLYDTYEKLIREMYTHSPIIYCLSNPAMIRKGISSGLDRPPQIG